MKSYGSITITDLTDKYIENTIMHYLATSSSSGITTSTSGWTTTIQTIDSSKKYLWTYMTISYNSGDPVNTTPVITGRYGDTGAAGASITNVSYSITYGNGTSSTSYSDVTFGNSIVNTNPERPYLWTKVTTTPYINGVAGTSVNSYSVSSTMDSVEVGGRNYLYNSNFSIDDLSKYQQRGGLSVSIDNNGYNNTNCLKVVFDTAGAAGKDLNIYLTTPNNYCEINTTYIFSGYAKADKECHLYSRFGYGATSNNAIIGTDWTRFEIKTVSGTEGWYLAPYINTATTLYLSNIKLEIGNVATDWSCAPEDIDASINDVNRVVDEINENMQESFDEVNGHITETENSIDGLKRDTLTIENNIKSTQRDIAAINAEINNVTFKASEIEQAINRAEEAITKVSAVFDKNIQITSMGIIITADSSGVSILIDNEAIRFYNGQINQNDLSVNLVAYISSGQFHIDNGIISDAFRIGGKINEDDSEEIKLRKLGFIFEYEDDGSLTLK